MHILWAYWGFVCMSLHLGFHWSMMLAMACKHLQPSPLRTWSLRLIGWLWAVYGAFAFRRRGVSLYLLLRSHFVFYDYSEPLIVFLFSSYAIKLHFAVCICTGEENEGFQREHPFDAGFPIGVRASLLAHDFPQESLVCYTFASG